jgi:hypothetical protein
MLIPSACAEGSKEINIIEFTELCAVRVQEFNSDYASLLGVSPITYPTRLYMALPSDGSIMQNNSFATMTVDPSSLSVISVSCSICNLNDYSKEETIKKIAAAAIAFSSVEFDMAEDNYIRLLYETGIGEDVSALSRSLLLLINQFSALTNDQEAMNRLINEKTYPVYSGVYDWVFYYAEIQLDDLTVSSISLIGEIK